MDSVILSPDNKSVYLRIPGLKGGKMYMDQVSGKEALAGMVTHIQLSPEFKSAANDSPWFYQSWYTINYLSDRAPFTSVDPVKPRLTGARITTGASQLEVAVTEDGPHSVEIFTMDGRFVASKTGRTRRSYSFSVKKHSVYLILFSLITSPAFGTATAIHDRLAYL